LAVVVWASARYAIHANSQRILQIAAKVVF
jgi:hypothetical protein